MESKFISRIFKLTFVLALIAGLIIGFYYSYVEALGVISGAFWAMANVYFLKKVLEEWLKIEKRNYFLFYAFLQLKFPLLYLIGYALIKVKLFPILTLVVGGSLMFLAIFFLGIQRAILDKDSQTKGIV